MRASISLSGDGKAPTSIVLLRKGVNASDHYGEGNGGEFIFDDISAAMVMAKFAADGRSRLYGDWNHGMRVPNATREQGASCCSFVPAIDADGNLIADDIQWTEDGRADVEGRVYNLFSPYFSWAWGDDLVCRVTGLVNFALVNLAGLKGIPELMAAASALTTENERTPAMDFEKLYNDTKRDLDAANARIRTLESAGTQMTALSMAIGVKVDAPEAERSAALSATVGGLVALRSSILKETGADAPEAAIAAVRGMVALRSEVSSITGQTAPEGMVGALRALKINADKAATLQTQIDEQQTAALTAEFAAVLDGAVKDLKVPPGKRAEVEQSVLRMAKVNDGKITREAVDGAKIFVSMLSAQVVGGNGTPQPKTGTTTLSAERLEIARQFGRKPEDIQAYESKRATGTPG